MLEIVGDRSEVDDLVVALHALTRHLRLDEVGDLGDLGAGGVPVLCRVGAHPDDDVVRVLRAALEPGAGEGVPQLGQLGLVVDDGGRSRQRDPRARAAVGHVDAGGGLRGDVAGLVAVALGDEEHVAVELHLLRRHRVADEGAVAVRVGQHRDADVLDQLGHLGGAVVLAHGVLLVVRVGRAVGRSVPEPQSSGSVVSRVAAAGCRPAKRPGRPGHPGLGED